MGHVEAGLRIYDKYSPYPEEMNRVLTGNIAELHFTLTIVIRKTRLRKILQNAFI